MIPCKPTATKLKLFILSFVVVFAFKSVSAQDGKALFQAKCQSCHNIFKDLTGPALGGLEERHKWADHNELKAWINNPGGYMAKDAYTQGLKAKYGSVMTSFPDVTLPEVTAIVDYINKTYAAGPGGPKGPGDDTVSSNAPDKSQNAVIFGVISLILAIIALVLMQVNSNLKKMSDDAEGIDRPEPVAFYRNKVYIAMFAIVFFIIGGYFTTKGMIGLQRQTNYHPEQPIFFSHKVHAGINQINCLYCHGNAWESKSAAIPSTNVCMNCHKAIQSYEKGPELFDGETKIDGTAEIAKLYKYAGFDPKNAAAWDPSKAKPIEWNKVHNLPDHVFFSHAQHVKAGNVQCQTCHGEVTSMNTIQQFSELSMGWCVNCHRQTKVQFNYDSTSGNKFYSIYEKFHNDIKSGKMDSVTVKDIGGLECQKCHY
ncbi:c-type cytochrome [Terrimonas sp. NA20]|uniref:C-type cytochrome n=1 Tax=Terrimonas ginsenosidimutans TaxID=2908004 RepID=A0ABS9KKM3_9BACT|nr:c-type cytochrome [Terrimonas ginsenosidimutans]MCG2612871.1 c-type cytochrome [Terrimonas ginsenosidimutans]